MSSRMEEMSSKMEEMSSRMEEGDVHKPTPTPVPGYQRRKPNYYPEEPPDFIYMPCKPRDPIQYAKIVWMTIAFVSIIILYCGDAIFFYYYGSPLVPTFKVNSLSVSSYKVDDPDNWTMGWTNAWDIEVSIENHNPFSNIKVDSMLFTMWYPSIPRIQGLGKPAIRTFRVNTFDITSSHKSIHIHSKRQTQSTFSQLMSTVLYDDWTRGSMNLQMQFAYMSTYSAFWAPFGTRFLKVVIDCFDLNVRFSTSRSETGTLSAPRVCDPTYDDVTKADVKRNRDLFNSDTYKGLYEEVYAT